MKFKKIASLLMATVLTVGSTSAIFARTNNDLYKSSKNQPMPYASDYISDYDVTIGPYPGCEISVSSAGCTVYDADTLRVEVEVQEKMVYTYNTVATYRHTVYNDNIAFASGVYKGTEGKTYRAHTTVSATFGSTTETRYLLSDTVVAYD